MNLLREDLTVKLKPSRAAKNCRTAPYKRREEWIVLLKEEIEDRRKNGPRVLDRIKAATNEVEGFNEDTLGVKPPLSMRKANCFVTSSWKE